MSHLYSGILLPGLLVTNCWWSIIMEATVVSGVGPPLSWTPGHPSRTGGPSYRGARHAINILVDLVTDIYIHILLSIYTSRIRGNEGILYAESLHLCMYIYYSRRLQLFLEARLLKNHSTSNKFSSYCIKKIRTRTQKYGFLL